MEGLFGCCGSLKSLTDISKWNNNQNNTVAGLFHCCESLISLPDISQWNSSQI